MPCMNTRQVCACDRLQEGSLISIWSFDFLQNGILIRAFRHNEEALPLASFLPYLANDSLLRGIVVSPAIFSLIHHD